MEDETVFEGWRFDVVRRVAPGPDGAPTVREWLRHAGAVTIIPVLDGDRVCLIRNHRVAVGRTLVELPAGTREAGEPADVTARRELIEETGYVPRTLVKLGQFYTSPGVTDERMFLYAATDLEPGITAREPGEQIENLVVPWAEAMRMAVDGTIEDAKTLVGLLIYDHQRRRPARGPASGGR